jgi:hypothetical protein
MADALKNAAGTLEIIEHGNADDDETSNDAWHKEKMV